MARCSFSAGATLDTPSEAPTGVADDDTDDDDDLKLDVSWQTGGEVPCEEGGQCEDCDAPIHAPCDGNPADLVSAIGLGCPGETPVVATFTGSNLAMGTIDHFGDTDEWDPTEGER